MNKLSEDAKAQKMLERSYNRRKTAVNSIRHNRDNMYRLLGMHIMKHFTVPNHKVYTFKQFKKYYEIKNK